MGGVVRGVVPEKMDDVVDMRRHVTKGNPDQLGRPMQVKVLLDDGIETLEVPQKAAQHMTVTADVQPQVDIWFQGVPFRHKDRYALEMLAEILNGRTGRLYKSMVEGEEIASSATAGVDGRAGGLASAECRLRCSEPWGPLGARQ